MNILIIDDDIECLESLSSALKLNGFDVQAFDSPQKALNAYNPDFFYLVITDYHLPGITGSQVVKRIHKMNAKTPVIVTSGDQQQEIANNAIHAGAYAFFFKPLNVNEIISIIKTIPGE